MDQFLRGHAWGSSITALFAVVVMSAGCGFDIPEDPAPAPRVQAIFDPVTSTIPLPNSAALDSDGTLPKLDAERDTAQAEFYAWLDGLDGWLPETDIEIPFDGALQEDSVTVDAVTLVEIAEDGALTELEVAEVRYVEVDEAPAASKVIVVPAAPLKPSTTYGVVATKDIKGADGEPVLESAPIFFGLNDGPLITEGGEVTIPQIASDPETARALEDAVRVHLAPLTAGLSDLGIERKDVATAFTWRTATNTFTILDSATATIPLPNTLALDEGTDGRPTFPAAALPSLSAWRAAKDTDSPLPRTAQVYFEEYLDDLHGWPNDVSSVPVELPLSGPIDEATLTADSAQLWVVGDDGVASRIEDVGLEYVADEESGVYKIVFQPAENFALNTDYFAFVTRDVTDPNGEELLPAAAMALALQPNPLVDEQGGSLVAELSDADAQAAAGVQALLAPTLAQIKEQAGLDYDDLASAWSWYTWRDPFIVFDPQAGDVPFPNAFLIGEDGTVSLPIPEGADPLTKALFEELNSRDGFSVFGDGWVSVLGAELDPASVKYFEEGQEEGELGSVAMASVPGALPEVLPADYMQVEYVPEYGKIMFRPQLPLQQDTLHAAILTNRLRGVNGLEAKPTPIFVMLKSEDPIYDEDTGESLIEQLPVASAPALEAARIQYKQLFVSAQLVTGDRRPNVVGAFAFTTDNATQPLQQLRARTMAKLRERDVLTAERACDVDMARDCDADLLDNSDGSFDAYTGPYDRGITQDFSNIAQIQWAAEYDTVNFLTDDGLAQWDDVTTARVPITVYVPKTVEGQCEPPFRVVIAQHGLGSSRLISGVGMANTMARPETCLAVVAVDNVLHGGRTDGLDDLHPTEHPEDSGRGFLGVDFVASKNNFMQGVMDLVVLNQIIRAGGLEDLVVNTNTSGMGMGMGMPLGPMFDTSKVGILGTSLGGIFSTDLTAVDPELNAAVLGVAPGKITYYLTEESGIGDMVLAPLRLIGIEKGTFEFEQLIAFVQWVADVIDPGAFASHIKEDTLAVYEYDPAMDSYSVVDMGGEDQRVPVGDVLAIMALDDPVAPNVSTRQLATILGVSLEDSTYEAPHAFMNITDKDDADYKEAECARRQAAFFLRAALDGEDTTIPDNLKAATCVANLN